MHFSKEKRFSFIRPFNTVHSSFILFRAEFPHLTEMQKVCGKTEKLVADLLCYFLGHLNRKNMSEG
jgi:hypothetical protein